MRLSISKAANFSRKDSYIGHELSPMANEEHWKTTRQGTDVFLVVSGVAYGCSRPGRETNLRGDYAQRRGNVLD